MAKQLKLSKGMESKLEALSQTTGRTSKYPYLSWFNGQAWLLESFTEADGSPTKGSDYNEKENTTTGQDARDIMVAKLKAAAKRHYLAFVILSKKDQDGEPLENGGIIVKTRPMTSDEREQNDKDRALTAKINKATAVARAAAKKQNLSKEAVNKAATDAAKRVRLEGVTEEEVAEYVAKRRSNGTDDDGSDESE